MASYKQLQQKHLIESFKRSMENSRRCQSRVKATIKLTEPGHQRIKTGKTSKSVESQRNYSSKKEGTKVYEGSSSKQKLVDHDDTVINCRGLSELSQIEK